MLVMVVSFMRMCYGMTCVVGGHVLQVCAEASIKVAVSLGICFFFFLQQFLFALRHVFQEFIV